MEIREIAEAFPPGEFIKEELDARGWTQDDLAEILGRQRSVVSAIVNGKRTLSPEIAKDLGAAFGTSAQLWMNLETAYRLFVESHVDEAVYRKARLFQIAPVKEMVRRNWIKPSNDLDTLEKTVLEFLEIDSLDEEPTMAHAAKKSTPYGALTPAQTAWLYRARKLAKGVHASKFSEKSFSDCLQELRRLLANPEDVRHVPRILAEAGIRFIVIESLPHAKIDGACLWLNEFSPVIAVSVRYDRLDYIWHVIGHECGHVEKRHGLHGDPYLDVNLVGDDAVPFDKKPEAEKEADRFSEAFLVDQDQMHNFIARVRPLYSKSKIINFASRIGVHPAIVLGQLQHRGEVEYSHSREMLVKIRDIIVPSALTDGWGQTLPASA